METLEAIMTRRSVRKFTNQQIEKEKLEKILQAAMAAPSAGGQAPWHFLLITDRAIIDKLPTVHPYARMCLTAQAVIIVCADPALQKHEGFWVQDLSAATENILLAVRDLGLAAVWCGVYPREDRVEGIKNLFALPAHVVPFALIPIGYSEVKQERKENFLPERVHRNKW